MSGTEETLRKLEIFSSLGNEEIVRLGTIAEEVHTKAGDVIIEEGRHSDSLYIIKSGCVMVKSSGGVNVILGEGAPLGELSFIDMGLPSATATAQEDSVLVRIPKKSFEGLLTSDSAFAYKIFRAIAVSLCRKLRDTNEWLQTKQWLSEIEKEARFLPKF